MIKKILWLILLTTLINSSGFSQNKKLDSLYILLKKETKDSTKIQLLLRIGGAYENMLPDSAAFFYTRALQLAEKNITKIPEETEDNSQAKLLDRFKVLKIKSLIRIGNFNCDQGNYNKAIEYYQKGLDLATIIKNNNEITNCLGNTGIVYYYMGNYNKAIEYYQKSLKINEKLGDTRGMASCYINIGSIHLDQGNNNKALYYYKNGLKLSLELKDKQGISVCYNNIGIIYKDKKKYDLAEEYFIKSYKIDQELGDQYGVAAYFNNMGTIYNAKKQYKKAIENYEKTLSINEELGDQNGVARALENIAAAHLSIGDSLVSNQTEKTNHYQQAINCALKAIKIAQEIESLPLENEAAQSLKKAYKNLGNYLKALEYADIYIKTNDSLFNSEKNKQLTEVEAKYQTEKKEQQIQLQKTEITKNQLQIKQQLLQKYITFGFLFFILIITVIIFISLRNKKKANILLSLKNEEILLQKEEITTQAEKLALINIQLEKLSIVASETVNAVLIADKTGIIEWINQGAIKMYGEKITEVVGKSYAETSSSPTAVGFLEKCLNEKKPFHYDSKGVYNSTEIFTQTNLTPVLDNEGKVSKIVIIDTDITEIKEAENEIKTQSDIIARKNAQITDSINYAVRIQQAMLPNQPELDNAFLNNFTLFKPKDIVSGDFYWFSKVDQYTFIALADCTGHGVPGAFMSMIGISLLNEIINVKKITCPQEILNELNKCIINSLNSDHNNTNDPYNKLTDGMEISLCRFENNSNEIQIAAAGHSVLILKNNTIEEIDGTFFSIGDPITIKKNLQFKKQVVSVNKNDTIIMFSDGYVDQFGGAENQKFSQNKFTETLLSITNKPMSEQKIILDQTIQKWINPEQNNTKHFNQTDDICIIGIKINETFKSI